MVIIALIIVSGMASFYLVYSKSYEDQIIKENDRQAKYMALSLYSFINTAYKTLEKLAHDNDILSMETSRQTPVLVETLKREDYFELLYAQGMDGMQTGRSSGNLGNRKQRPWFIHMEQIRQPFVYESYFSVTTNMPAAAVFHPITKDGEMIGIIGGDIKLSALNDMVMETSDEGSWTYILDGKGAFVAHPDATYLEELYNYAKLSKTVKKTDAGGEAMRDEAGNIITEEQHVRGVVSVSATVQGFALMTRLSLKTA